MIYFISQEHRFMKIGYTERDPEARLSSLQTGNPHALTLYAVIPGDLCDEAAIHDVFAPLHVRGEWFMISPEMLQYIYKRKNGADMSIIIRNISGNRIDVDRCMAISRAVQ